MFKFFLWISQSIPYKKGKSIGVLLDYGDGVAHAISIKIKNKFLRNKNGRDLSFFTKKEVRKI